MSNDIQNINWPGWEAVRLIGRGSFGAVYEIQRKVFKETESAALKVISIPQNSSDIDEMYNDGYDDESITSTFQSHLESIVAEYSLMRKMNGSANIVNCEDVRYVQHDDGFGWDIFIKMELLTPLAKSLPDPVEDDTVIKIAKDMCSALELCKKHDVIHRDIKPQNIFVSPNGDYKLGDFGIAKVVEKTMGGTKIGTYKYMAPEVYNNQPYGASADIYSLGLVLYWLLNDRRMPFLPPAPEKLKAGMEENARIRRLNGEQIPSPVHGSEQLKRIVLKACAFDVRERYRSATEMLHDLHGLSSPNESIHEDECAVLENSTSEHPADEPPKREEPKHVPRPHDETLDKASHADDQSTEQKKLTPYLVLLVAAWVGSVAASIWTLSNIKLYVPHIFDGSSPWIYISLITSWCIPLVAFMAAKYNKKTICGVSSKTICQIAVVAQLVVFALDFEFLIVQEYLRFVPGALLLSETYWIPGYLQNEWMPFVVCLFAFILLIAKDCLALWILAKNNLQERKISEADKSESGVRGFNNQSKRFNKRNLLFKWLPLIAILLYLLFLLLNPVALIKRMFADDMPEDSTPSEETSQTISESECNHDWISVENNEFELATFRHIPIIFSDTSDAAKAESLQKTQDIVTEWQAAGSTEDAFAQLHEKYSTDLSIGDGGLVSNASRNDLVDNIAAWLFDELHKQGDWGIIETEAGYVVVYFISADTYRIDSTDPHYCLLCHETNGTIVPLVNPTDSSLQSNEPRQSRLIAGRWGGAVIDDLGQLWLWFDGSNNAIKTPIKNVKFIDTDKLWGEKLVFIKQDGSVGYITINADLQTYSDEISVDFPEEIVEALIFDYSILYALDCEGTLYECDLSHTTEGIRVDGVPSLVHFQCIDGASSPTFFGRGTDGNFYGWGYNSFGSFTDSERANIPSPVKLNIDNSLDEVLVFNSRIDSLCGFVFVNENQTAEIYNAQGINVATVENSTSVYAGEASLYITNADGNLLVYGAHSSGEAINMGTEIFKFDGTFYRADGFGKEVSCISSDGWSVAVMLNDGTIRCWGQEIIDCQIVNSDGQLFSAHSVE